LPDVEAKPESKAPARFAKMHPAPCLAQGLFLTRKNGGREDFTTPVVLAEQTMSSGTYRFIGTEPLGVEDMRVLQGVFMLASRPSETVELEVGAARTDVGVTLSANMNFSGPAEALRFCKYTHINISALAEACGYGTAGGSRTVVEASLERLSRVRVSVTGDDGRITESALLAHAPIPREIATETDRPKDTHALVIHPALSAPLLSDSKGVRHVRVEHSELAALGKSGVARILHMRLCAIADPGSSKGFTVRTLLGYAYADSDNKSTERRRIVDVREAMAVLGSLPGWSVTGDDRKAKAQVFTVRRPAAGNRSKAAIAKNAKGE